MSMQNYKLIGTGLSRQANTSIPQEEDDGATMLFITEKQQKIILHFSLASLIVSK